MCLFVTSSSDGYVNMYNLWTAELIRTFTSQFPVYSAILAQSPVPMCAFFTRDDHMWNAYTLNGAKLEESGDDKERHE